MAAVSQFDDETAAVPDGPGRWRVALTDAWNIGDTANGGYVAATVLRCLGELTEHPDPWSVTTHFLRPVQPRASIAADVAGRVVRAGRTTTLTAGAVSVDGREHVAMSAVFGDLGANGDDGGPVLTVPAPLIPDPTSCVDRSELAQGVELPILRRLDVRIAPARAAPAGSDDAVIEGWIRFADRTAPTAAALVLFGDAFPPSLYPRFGRIGWVPTIELTVHVRRRPAPGWVQARLECDDLADGRMIETGSLWDSTGALVARTRQLGLLLT